MFGNHTFTSVLVLWVFAAGAVAGIWIVAGHLNAVLRSWRTRRLIKRWSDADRRRRERLAGEPLIDEIRRRYDGLPVRSRR